MSAHDNLDERALLSGDTTAEIDHLQVARWRQVSPAEKLRIVSDTSREVRQLALAGARRRYPSASARECFLRDARAESMRCKVNDTVRELQSVHQSRIESEVRLLAADERIEDACAALCSLFDSAAGPYRVDAPHRAVFC